MAATAVDITERKRAEEEIHKLNQYLGSIIDNANIWLDVLDEKAQVVIWNKAAEQISGFSREEVVGHGKIWEWLYPDERYRKEITTKAAAIIEKGEMVEDFETTIRCKNEEIKTISWHSRDLLGADGKPIGSIALGRDVTEKKKMEAQLIQSERLAAVGTLAYGIAHEFNNILAGILGNAEFGMGNDDPEETRECFRIIMESCDRAKSITNSLLAFSGQRETKKQRADVTEAVETILGLVERELEKQNIKTVRKFSPIPEIVCDLGELSGVVLNMITNARDAMRPNGGTLTIEIEKKGDNIEIIFTDSGCGIPDSIKSRIFEPFVTTKGALGQSEIPGTGLGLFLSYGIIKRYEGEIGVKSEVGKGSKFTIRIPISKNQVAPALVKGEEEKPMDVPKNLHILLVDDEKPICTAIKKFFEAKGHSVTTALSGKKGLEIFKKGSFDLVLTDITMPDMDGLELISKLKKIDPQLKFIVLTGHITEDMFESAKRAGAHEVLVKPFGNEELYQAIGKIFAI
jgi:PAS domain S-box-containing protein